MSNTHEPAEPADTWITPVAYLAVRESDGKNVIYPTREMALADDPEMGLVVPIDPRPYVICMGDRKVVFNTEDQSDRELTAILLEATEAL